MPPENEPVVETPVVPVAPAAVEPAAAAAEPTFSPSILETEGAKEAVPAKDEPPVELKAVEPPKEPVKEPEPSKDEKKVEAKSVEPVKEPEPSKDEKKVDEKPAEPVAPEPIAYDFKFPEGVNSESVDKPTLERYTGLLSKARVPAETAQELLDLHIEQSKQDRERIQARQWDVFHRQQEKWQEAVKADSELGGSRIKTVMRTCASVIEQFGGSPAQQKVIHDVMRATGAGNNPDVLRLFYRVGQVLASEGKPLQGQPTTPGPMTREQRAQTRYKQAG